jgi:hypothetical protein
LLFLHLSQQQNQVILVRVDTCDDVLLPRLIDDKYENKNKTMNPSVFECRSRYSLCCTSRTSDKPLNGP